MREAECVKVVEGESHTTAKCRVPREAERIIINETQLRSRLKVQHTVV